MPGRPPLKIYTLPLFPLNSVLFPNFPIQLHIFEERYRVMIQNCVERNEPFGVVLIREGSEVGAPAIPDEIGCTARILAVHPLENGRMHLLAAGENRFRILEYMEGDLPYLIGRVEAFEDDPLLLLSLSEEDALSERILEVTELFQQYLVLLAASAGIPLPEMDLPDDPAGLAFCIASVMQLPLEDKQRLLCMTDVRERLETEADLLREHIEEMAANQMRGQTEAPTVLLALPMDSDNEIRQQFLKEGRN